MTSSILIIDDEPTNYEVIETLLANEDYELYYVSTGEEALATIDRFAPDVILLDLMMPGMDGLEVCRQLRLVHKWRSIPIIIVTAKTEKSILAQCLDAGADDFISKPVDKLEIRARVKSMVRTKKQFDRIDSLSRLQQKSIAALEQDLDKLVYDLAIGFANELGEPLVSAGSNLSEIIHNSNSLDKQTIVSQVDCANTALLEIEELTNEFLSYLELFSDRKYLDSKQTCSIKDIAERVRNFYEVFADRHCRLAIDIPNVIISLEERHCETIFKELLRYQLKIAQGVSELEIYAEVVNRYLEISIGRFRPSSDIRPLWKIPELENNIVDNTNLTIGLKIVKKIIDAYDGIFRIYDLDGSIVFRLSLLVK
jgi:two-component system, sensor histidine kinase and response regulator